MKARLAVAVAAVLATASGCRGSETPPPPRAGQIAFTAIVHHTRDYFSFVAVIDADGTGLTLISGGSGHDSSPAWSPDGARVAYASTMGVTPPSSSQDAPFLEVCVTNADGTATARLTENTVSDEAPTWSPDGAKIAFVSSRDGNGEIYVMNADGSAQTNLSQDGAADRGPAWSPDGAKIAFTLDRGGGVFDVYVMNADGSAQTNLSRDGTSSSPAWSPDGAKLAFVSSRDGNAEIYVMNADGSAQTNLSRNGAADHDPAWSPDGAKLAFVSRRDGNDEIYVMNVDGSAQANLSRNGRADREPAWSPDGASIAFSADSAAVYVMDADGRRPTRLAEGSGPRWRPRPP